MSEQRPPRRTKDSLPLIWQQVLGSLTALALAVVPGWSFYRRGLQRRGVVYRVREPRTVVVRADRPGALGVTYRGAPLKGAPLVAVDVQFWCNGTDSIRRGNILRPITLALHEDLLGAEVSATSRPLCQVAVEDLATANETDPGQAQVAWDILEPGDWFTISLLYAGPPHAPVAVQGFVEGQREGVRLANPVRQRLGWVPRALGVGAVLLLAVHGLFSLALPTLELADRSPFAWLLASILTFLSLALGSVALLVAIAGASPPAYLPPALEEEMRLRGT